MKFKRLQFFLIAALLANLSYTSFIKAAPKVEFGIVYTNDVMGEVEPCG